MLRKPPLARSRDDPLGGALASDTSEPELLAMLQDLSRSKRLAQSHVLLSISVHVTVDHVDIMFVLPTRYLRSSRFGSSFSCNAWAYHLNSGNPKCVLLTCTLTWQWADFLVRASCQSRPYGTSCAAVQILVSAVG